MTLNRKDVVSNLSRKGFKTIEKTKHTALIHQNSIGQRTGSIYGYPRSVNPYFP